MHAFLEGMSPDIVRVMVQSTKSQDLGHMLEVANTFTAADDDSRDKGKSLGIDYYGLSTRQGRSNKKQHKMDQPRSMPPLQKGGKAMETSGKIIKTTTKPK